MLFVNIHTHRNIADDKTIAIKNIIPCNDDETPFFENQNKYFSIGLHPWHIKPDTIVSNLEIVKKTAGLTNCLAIGETGLDRNIMVAMELQKEVFLKHLEIARELSKPVIIHCVKAFQEVLLVHKPFAGKVKLIFHGFNNNRQTVINLLEKGHYLSFGKALLNPVSNASKLFHVVPNDRFFLETDDSEIPISTIYLRASALKSISMDEMKEGVLRNFENCFGKKL